MSRPFRSGVVLLALFAIAFGGGCMRPLFMSGPLENMSAQAHRNVKRARRAAERTAREEEREAKKEAKQSAVARSRAPSAVEQLELGPLTDGGEDLLNVGDAPATSASPAARVAANDKDDVVLPSANAITEMLGEPPTAEIGGHPKAEGRLADELDNAVEAAGYSSLDVSPGATSASSASAPRKPASYRPGSTASNPYEQLAPDTPSP